VPSEQPPNGVDLPVAPTPPTPPTPAPLYELPTARKVVSTGLQLALTSTSQLRKASIYIGLLVLGAFGPAIVAVLLIVGRLGDQAGDAFGSVFFGQAFGAPPQPALEAALLLVALEALVGLVLFFTISIDAQVMGIAILGGRASQRPLRLWEAIIRARQTFWRMAGAGTLVGVIAGVVQLLILGALGGLSRSADTASILASLIATILIAPLAYVATSIVIGNVGAMEALSRSWRLFKARRGLAVAVVLFTFVTSAIQLFALSAGLEVVVRAAEILQVSLTEGLLPFATAIVLVLAAVVAYGSLTFTIGAVVSAPQVAGFLGLTFYAEGLDKARVDAATPPSGFRYVSRPMIVSIIALTGLVGLQIPSISSIPIPVPSPSPEAIRAMATSANHTVTSFGTPMPVSDPSGDQLEAPAAVDIVLGEVSYLPVVPRWLATDAFDCAAPNVACGSMGYVPTDLGAHVFLVQLAGDLERDEDCRPCQIAVAVAEPGEERAPSRAGITFPEASAAIVVTFGGFGRGVAVHTWFDDRFSAFPTRARARWTGSELLVLVPDEDLRGRPVTWNVHGRVGTLALEPADWLGAGAPTMLPFPTPQDLWIDPVE
jgi:hypothetical protein